ncbi:hypothetical protein REPUB_Repub06bG0049800 [Reevesia pubescens]
MPIGWAFPMTMSDGTTVMTEVVSEWCTKETKRGFFKSEYKLCVSLLKLCSELGCLLIRLENPASADDYLKRFFAVKDIMFVGVRMKEDLQNLKDEYGIIIRNAVDLSELSAKVLGRPQLSAYGARELARKVLSLNIQPRSLMSIWTNRGDYPTLEQIETAATDAYATYRVGRRLLGTGVDGGK